MENNTENIQSTVSGLVDPKRMKQVSGWASLASFPSNICVHGQNTNEYVLLFIREHKIILFFNLLLYLIVFLIPYVLKAFISHVDNDFLNNALGSDVFFSSKWWAIILVGWVAYMLTGFFNIFFHWFYNINIVTTEKFLDIDFETIFSNKVETASLIDIQDVKDVQNGIIQSTFNMGDIILLTASGGTIFSLNNVPKAHKVRDFIVDVCTKVKQIKKNKNG